MLITKNFSRKIKRKIILEKILHFNQVPNNLFMETSKAAFKIVAGLASVSFQIAGQVARLGKQVVAKFSR